MRLASGVATSVAVGLAFGAATSLVNQVPGLLGEVGQAHTEDSAVTWTAIFVSLILDSGWAWAALGFALGWIAVSPLVGALMGVVGLSAATVAYYSVDLLFDIDAYWSAVGFWLVRAVVLGLPLGVAGALARRPGVVGLLAALTVPVGAALNMVVLPVRNGLPGESSAAGWAELTVWVAASGGAALVLVRFWLRSRPRSAVAAS